MSRPDSISRSSATLDSAAKAALRAIGASLRAARTERGLTRDQLGGRIFVSRATLQRIEAGDPRVAVGYLLAAGSFLDVPVLSPLTRVSLDFDHVYPSNMNRALIPGAGRARRKRVTDDWFK